MPQRLQALLEASRALTTETSLEGVLQRVIETARDLIGAGYGAIGVLGPDGRSITTFATSGVTAAERAAIGSPPAGHGILGLVIREAKVIRLADLGRHPDAVGFPPHHPTMRSFLGVPIRGRDRVFGNLYLTEKRGAPSFTDDDEQIALLLAAQAAAAVENARLHEETARLLEEVQRLMRNRQRFFAMVNHELRNALTGVLGWAEMAEQPRPGISREEATRETVEAANEAITLVTDLLDLSRLDESRLPLQLTAQVPRDLVGRAITLIRPRAEQAGIALSVEDPGGLPQIRADAQRVQQILQNLLINAVRHAPRGSTVRVRLLPDIPAGEVVFEVLDAGPGVAEGDVHRIFDPYETLGDGTSVGLGLPISRRLATILGGSLMARHHPEGGGHFTLRLPVLPVER